MRVVLAALTLLGHAPTQSADTFQRERSLDINSIVTAVAISPDGKRFAAAGTNSPTITLWDSITGAEITTLGSADKWMLTIAFTPDGKQLVVGGVVSLILWKCGAPYETQV